MDLGQLTTAVLRNGIDAATRSAVKQIALNLRPLIPVVEAQARAGQLSDALVRAIRSAAAAGEQALLVLPPGNGPARLDLPTRQFIIPQALRDVLLNAQAANELPAAPAARAANATAAGTPVQPPSAAALLSSADAARAWLAQSQSAASLAGQAEVNLRDTLRDAARRAPALAFNEPLLALDEGAAPTAAATRAAAGTNTQSAPTTDAIAQRLTQALTRSGLFFESHVAQWHAGERTLDDVRAEYRQVVGAAGEALIAEARMAGRTAAQIDALQSGAVVLQGPAWPGQSVAIELGREQHSGAPGGHHTDAGGASTAPTYYATLRLSLPRLGELTVRLRLSDSDVAAHFENAHAQMLEAALPEFAAALHARGLRTGALSATEAERYEP